MINSILFNSSMERQEDAIEIAKIIIKRATGRVVDNIFVESEKSISGVTPDMRGIRMDVLVTNLDDNKKIKEVYDIEPNHYYEPNIAKRTRYYNSLTNVKLLSKSKVFSQLPEMFSIWILPYDPFGENRMLYTVKNVVTECPNIEYNDGVTNLFLNTRGELGGSDELEALLRHIEHTVPENAVDEDLKKIQNIVDSVKSDERLGGIYMTLEEMIEYEKAIAIKDGLAEGMAQGMAQGIAQGMAQGITQGDTKRIISLICKKIQKEKDIETIADELETDIENIKELYCIIYDNAPNYDVDSIYELYTSATKEA